MRTTLLINITNLQPYPIIFTIIRKISRNNDLLLLNLVNKYVLSDLLKLEMVLDFCIRLHRKTCVSCSELALDLLLIFG